MKVLQIRMTDEEHAFLKAYAEKIDKSMSKALLHMAGFHQKMQEGETKQGSIFDTMQISTEGLEL